MSAMRPLVIIPTYNEAENIERMLHRIADSLPKAGILVVDDGSPDGTGDLVKAAAAELPDVHLLTRSGKSGLGSAYRAGFAWGLQHDYDALIEMDADFSHDPAALPDIVGPLGRGLRFVHRVAVREGGRHPQLGPPPPPPLLGREPLCLGGARTPCGGLDRRIQGLQRRHHAQARPERHPGRRVRLPDRNDLSGQAARGGDRRGAHHLRRPRRRRVRKCPRGSCSKRWRW